MEFQVVSDISYSISEKTLLERIDDRPHRSLSDRLRKSIKRAVGDIRTSSDFRALFGITNVETNNGSLVVSDQRFDSRKLKSVLSPCRRALVFLATLGADIDRLIKQKMIKKPSYGYILDAAASVAVESGTDTLIEQIGDDIIGDFETTQSYSPGYCDWQLSEQEKLFSLIPHERIGVTLNKSYLMNPRKSISGIAGICRKGYLRFSGNACLSCLMTDCPYRRGNQKQ